MAIGMVLRKIWHNRGLMASLLVGMLLAGALVALIPTFARMSLHRTFRNELETFQQESGVYPGMALITAFYNENSIIDVLNELERNKQSAYANDQVLGLLAARKDSMSAVSAIADALDNDFDLPQQIRVDNLCSTGLRMQADKPLALVKTGKLQSLSRLTDNMTLLRGTVPAAPQGAVYQALATEDALLFFGAEVGDTLHCVPRLDETFPPIAVQVVGTFDVDPDKPLAWGFFKPSMFSSSLLLRPEDAQALLLDTPVLAASSRHYIAYDYRQMLAAGLDSYQSLQSALSKRLLPLSGSFELPALQKVASFSAREKSLRTTLWMLNIPVLMMLALYMAMVSGMVIDNDAGEISLLVSRGAGGGLVFSIYLLLGLVLSVAALAAGPSLASLLCRVLGSADGFLSFVQRGVPNTQPDLESYLYCAAALLLAVWMLALPALRRRHVSIVAQKRVSGSLQGSPWWRKMLLDVVLLGASLGAWYLLKTKPEWAASATGELNPAIFALMPCFAIGATLCFLRVYPLLIKLLYALGHRFWRAGTYLALLRVSRNTASYRYIMVFLALTVAVGVFSASAARTLNDTETDRLHYAIGTDVTVSVNWPRQGAQNVQVDYAESAKAEEPALNETRRFQEPLFSPYRTLAGVESAARVFLRGAVHVTGARDAGNVQLMAIDPADFGRTAWFRNDLWSAHFYDYLNALSVNERACLISASLANKLNAQMGDWLTAGWEGSDSDLFYVAGIVGHWPGWNPYPAQATDPEPLLMVADLATVQALLGIEPYSVWLKTAPGASLQALYADMSAAGIRPTALRSFAQESVAQVNASMRLAINGVMTLGFMASCIVCALGFILYWQMYLRKNQLQLGLQRGMGLTVWQLIGMLLVEQSLTCLVALGVGVFIGNVGSLLFVPLFEYAHSAQQAPPFRVRMLASDRRMIYAIMGSMLVLCWAYLGAKMRGMKVAQAIKLGED